MEQLSFLGAARGQINAKDGVRQQVVEVTSTQATVRTTKEWR